MDVYEYKYEDGYGYGCMIMMNPNSNSLCETIGHVVNHGSEERTRLEAVTRGIPA